MDLIECVWPSVGIRPIPSKKNGRKIKVSLPEVRIKPKECEEIVI